MEEGRKGMDDMKVQDQDFFIITSREHETGT